MKGCKTKPCHLNKIKGFVCENTEERHKNTYIISLLVLNHIYALQDAMYCAIILHHMENYFLKFSLLEQFEENHRVGQYYLLYPKKISDSYSFLKIKIYFLANRLAQNCHLIFDE